MPASTLNAPANYDVKKLRQLNTLLVEDNPLNIKLVSILFFQNGLKLHLARNGAEAVEKIKLTDFDIVLMDMEMPVMSGYQATTVIRQQLKNNIPIIAMTAHALAGEREKCLQLGMNAYIAKPINDDELFSIIYNLTCSNKAASQKTGITNAAVPAVITEKVCKLDYLVNVTRGNKKMINNIVDVFMEETPVELSALNAAIKKTNYNIISDIAHKLKSSFSILGISVLEPVFEKMGKLGDNASGIEKIRLLNYRINTVFNQAKEEMKLI